MHRIGKQTNAAGSGRGRSDLPVSMTVQERLGRKIRIVSAKTRLPERIIAGEAIARGFALLKS